MSVSSPNIVTWHPLVNGCAPAWASGWGEDCHGPFVDFHVGDVMQRLRWVPEGTFQMGSPTDEPGRFDNEGPQHWVKISRGFWLFDTPCPQNLWEAVMGENPSRFKSPQRPVENVSWNDCQRFIERFDAVSPGLRLALPTEAEWEYACRAGTEDATYAGPIEILGQNNAPVLDAIAWYAGNCGVKFDLDEGHDTSSWSEKQHEFDKGGTRIYAMKTPNPWGLYDMLGNVLEWCRDGKREYSAKLVTDPVGPEGASAERVIRGGSWFSNARYVRAASRYLFHPGLRFDYIGFRCRVL